MIHLLISLLVLLLVSKLFGSLAKHFRQPVLIGEILAGIFLGPSLLGRYFQNTFLYLFSTGGLSGNALHFASTIGLFFFLFSAGLEVEIPLLRKGISAAFRVSIAGLVLPFLLGSLSVLFFPDLFERREGVSPLVLTLFIGTALSISALPVIVKILIDLKLYKTELGTLILSAATVDDLLGWLIFGFVLALFQHSSFFSMKSYIALGMIGFILILFLGRKNIFSTLSKALNSFPLSSTLKILFIIPLAWITGLFTEYLGLHMVFGTFLSSAASGTLWKIEEKTKASFSKFIQKWIAPFFFASIGIKIDIAHQLEIRLTLLILFFACLGKISACSLSAYFSKKSWNQSLAIAFAMNARGGMEIILGFVALKEGIIGEKILSSLIVMAIITTLMSGPFINFFVRREGNCPSP